MVDVGTAWIVVCVVAGLVLAAVTVWKAKRMDL